MDGAVLAVGDPARRRAGQAILLSLGIAAVFAAVTVLTKETPALELRQPWQDDPYDVPVSLDFAVLPLLVVIGVLRVQLCRRFAPLPTRRVVDLLRVARAAIWLSLATQATEWVAVLLGRHRPAWTAATYAQLAGLVLLTGAAIGAAVLLRRATRAVAQAGVAAPQPDWLADGVALGLQATRMLGRHAVPVQAGLSWLDGQIAGRVRAHPVPAAGVLAAALAAPFVVAKIVLEGYPAGLVLFIAVFVTAAMFALVIVVGCYLRVVPVRPGGPSVRLSALLGACVAGPAGFAFHDSLLVDHQTVGGLCVLFGVSAALGAILGVAVHVLWRTGRRAA